MESNSKLFRMAFVSCFLRVAEEQLRLSASAKANRSVTSRPSMGLLGR